MGAGGWRTGLAVLVTGPRLIAAVFCSFLLSRFVLFSSSLALSVEGEEKRREGGRGRRERKRGEEREEREGEGKRGKGRRKNGGLERERERWKKPKTGK